MRSFIKSHRRTNSDETAVETGGGDGLRLVGDSSLRSRLKNPITFIKQRRRTNGEEDEHVPSAADYKEAGSIFGTRTHDWDSLRSGHEQQQQQQQQPVPSVGALALEAQKTTAAEPGVEIEVESQNSEAQAKQTQDNNNSHAKKNIASSAVDEDIQELEDKIDEMIHETLNGLELEALPPQASGDDDIIANGERDINSNSSRSRSSSSSSSSGSGHSAFSFEEDNHIGRNTSVSYHTTPDDISSTPPTAAANGSCGIHADIMSKLPASQFQDEYYDDFNEIYRRNNGHLLGISQFVPADGGGDDGDDDGNDTPHLFPSFSTLNAPDDYSGSYNNNGFKDDDDDEDDDFYDSLLDEVNAVPDDDVDDVPPPLQRNGSRSSNSSSYTPAYTPMAPSSYYRPANCRQMLRKAKSYSFEGSRSQLATSNLAMRRRQTSVIKSDTTTTTLFGKLPQETTTAPLPLYLNTQSAASFLGKKLSNASSLSNLTTLSTSNMSLKDRLDYYYYNNDDDGDDDNDGKGEADDDIGNLELCYPSKASTALTPISERSYDSDYSRSPV